MKYLAPAPVMVCALLLAMLLAGCTEAPSPVFTTPVVAPRMTINPSLVQTAAALNTVPGVNLTIITTEARRVGNTDVPFFAQNDPVIFSFSTERTDTQIFLDSCNVGELYMYKPETGHFEAVSMLNPACPGLGQPQQITPKQPYRNRVIPNKIGLAPGFYQISVDFYTGCPAGALLVAVCGNGIPNTARTLVFAITDEIRPTPVPVTPSLTASASTPVPTPVPTTTRP